MQNAPARQPDDGSRTRPPGRPASRSPLWLRAVAIGFLIVLAESLHGFARSLWLEPLVGDLRARQLGVVTGALIIVAIALATARWLAAGRTSALLAVGVLWVALMIAFEIGLGRVLGYSWTRIAGDYDPRDGGWLAAGMAVLLLAPWIGARLRDTDA